jgi:hypothetical protein
MPTIAELRNLKFWGLISIGLPLLVFWVVLLINIPYSVTFHFNTYSLGLFVIVLLLYYFSLRLRGSAEVFAGLCLTMLLFALALSYKWTSGFSDNFMIGGLLPYKDAKNYYLGANLLLQGLPLEKAGQATERPLFPGFLSSLLLLTGHNLKIALAIIVQLAGIGLYLSARQVSHALGAWSASLYITLMYFYIQPLTGYTLSEVPGFMLGCFAFLLLWRTTNKPDWFDLILGLITLLVAVSMRAGAFLIFPLLTLWVGWRFRGEKRFSVRAAAVTFIIIVVGYFLVNSIYDQTLGIPPGAAFGNFSYAIYGQVRGGTGWHSAIEELGTRDPSTVYRAALQFFLKHPLSLFIGFAKAYRDFFLPGDPGIFPFGDFGWQNWPNLVLWMGMLLLLIWGSLKLLKDLRSNLASMLVWGFWGVLISIPFLPPIDGGARFYASTMPFFFIIPAVGLSYLTKQFAQQSTLTRDRYAEPIPSRSISILLLALTLLAPIATFALGQKPAYTVPACPTQQKPFVVQAYPDSYIDLVKQGTSQCGSVPAVCFDDFEENNTEKSRDDYYQHTLLFVERAEGTVRIVPAIDLVQEKFHYFYFPQENVGHSSFGLVSGCAIEVETKNQRIYQVEAVASDTK